MKRLIVSCRQLAVLLVLFACALPALAQQTSAPPDPAMRDLAQDQAKRSVVQPGNNAFVWREVRSGDPKSGYASLPGRETNVLVQTEGQEWRARRNGFWSIVSGWALVGTAVMLALFHLWKGTTQLEHPETGRKIVRFTQFQRWVHWTVAVSFCILAISGLVMLFGKNIVLPIIGYTLFSWLAEICKNLHNFVGPLFFVSILVMLVTFIHGNFYRAGDLKWLLTLGGLFSKGHVPSGRYNAGEKVWYWGGVLFLGLLVSLSGLVLDFPNFDQTRSTMQLANIIHLIGTGLFMVGGLGHIYLGTLGMAGAYEGMKTGLVDEEWAREHHELWYNDIKSRKVSADPEGEKARAISQAASGSAN
jgi:formate dehydrogenase subunit gamma